MADTATMSAAMKTKFLGPVRDNLHSGFVLLYGGDSGNPEGFQGITSSAENIDFVGNEVRTPLLAKRSSGIGFRNENDTLPEADASEFTYISEPQRHAYGVFSITGQLMKASESSEGAFKSAFKQEMEHLTLSSKIDMNRAAFGNGVGVLATVSANEAAGQTVISVDTTINFRTGEMIDGLTIATGVVIEPARKVTAVDRTNLTITVTPALTTGLTASTDGWVRSSSNSTVAVPNNSWNREIQGLSSIVAATGTLHGVSPTSYPFWASTVVPSAGAISDTLLDTAMDNVGFESGKGEAGGTDFVLMTTRGIRRRYKDTLTSMKRFTEAKPVKLNGGFTAVMFNENPIFVDDYCPVGNVFGLRPASLAWSQMSDWDWMDQDGAVLKQVSGKDKYQAILFKYCNLLTTARNEHFRLTGVTDDAK